MARNLHFLITQSSRGGEMPQGSKAAYTDKQKRKAEHIEDGYKKKGVSSKEASKRAWATVNKEEGSSKKSGSDRGKKVNHESSRKVGRHSHSSNRAA